MDKAADWVSYANSSLGVMLSRPIAWQVSQMSATQFVVSSPAEATGYRAQLSYLRMTPDGTDDAWFAETIRYSEAQQRAAYPDYRLLRSEQLVVAGVRGFWRQCEWRYENSDIFSVNLQVLIWPNTSTLFVLKAATLKALAGRDVPVIEQMILSTTLL